LGFGRLVKKRRFFRQFSVFFSVTPTSVGALCSFKILKTAEKTTRFYLKHQIPNMRKKYPARGFVPGIFFSLLWAYEKRLNRISLLAHCVPATAVSMPLQREAN
jgi:hypothetical protein